jgi:hypothetical protein
MASYGTAPLPLWGTLAIQPGPRFQQIGDGDGGASPSPDKSGTGTARGERPRLRANRGRAPRPRPRTNRGRGRGSGIGVSVPWDMWSDWGVPRRQLLLAAEASAFGEPVPQEDVEPHAWGWLSMFRCSPAKTRTFGSRPSSRPAASRSFLISLDDSLDDGPMPLYAWFRANCTQWFFFAIDLTRSRTSALDGPRQTLSRSTI